MLHGAGWRYGGNAGRFDPLYVQATTVCLSTIVIMQMVNDASLPASGKSSLSFGLSGNPYLLFGVAAGLALILFIVYTPAGQWLFGTSAIAGEVWLGALFCARYSWASSKRRARPAGGGASRAVKGP